jgi:hypothetical protein
MKYFFLLGVCTGLLAITGVGQQANAQSASWTTLASNAKVEIQQTPGACTYDESPMDNGQMAVLRVRNKTNAPVQVTFRVDVYYGDDCATCANPEYVFTATIPANGSIQGGCNADSPQKSMLTVLTAYTNRTLTPAFNRIEINQLTAN